ncbi:MAG: hypothetical protein LUC22_05375, partial [Prevotella sp.]|nr:hypothetical protein [Prevotella sp.]
RITDLIATIEGLKREARTVAGRPLERRANQLAMDCVYPARRVTNGPAIIYGVCARKASSPFLSGVIQSNIFSSRY